MRRGRERRRGRREEGEDGRRESNAHYPISVTCRITHRFPAVQARCRGACDCWFLWSTSLPLPSLPLSQFLQNLLHSSNITTLHRQTQRQWLLGATRYKDEILAQSQSRVLTRPLACFWTIWMWEILAKAQFLSLSKPCSQQFLISLPRSCLICGWRH